MADATPFKHGASGYKHRKCRCDVCRAGHREESARYREKNLDKENARKMRWAKANPELVKATRERNRDTRLAQQAAYRENNRVELAAKQRRYYADNREACRKQARQRSAETSVANVERSRKWRQGNREAYRAHMRNSARRRRVAMANVLHIYYTDEQLAQKYAYWGNMCYIRGIKCTGSIDALEHVIPIKKGGPDILANIRPVCKPCNSRKWAHWPYSIPHIPGGPVS